MCWRCNKDFFLNLPILTEAKSFQFSHPIQQVILTVKPHNLSVQITSNLCKFRGYNRWWINMLLEWEQFPRISMFLRQILGEYGRVVLHYVRDESTKGSPLPCLVILTFLQSLLRGISTVRSDWRIGEHRWQYEGRRKHELSIALTQTTHIQLTGGRVNYCKLLHTIEAWGP